MRFWYYCILIRDEKKIKKLISRIAGRADQAAFEELYNIYFAWLKSVSISIVRKNEDAEEIIEDVFVKLWTMRDKLGQIKNIETYLYTATKNKSFNYIKKYYKAYAVELEDENTNLGYIISPEEALIIKELKNKINLAVAQLPDKCRQVFLAVREQGLSHKKAAEQLGVSPKTIENQLSIGIRKIKHELDAYMTESKRTNLSNGDALLLLSLIIYC